MNSEIERLAKEAGGHVSFETFGHGKTEKTWSFSQEQLAKFAALIAEECYSEIEKLIKPGDLGGNGCDGNAQRNGYILAAQVIRAKFALSHEAPEAK